MAPNIFTERGDEFAKAGAAAQQSGAPQPSAEQLATFQQIAQNQIFTEGATTAFLVGAALMLGASLVVWIFLNVKHEELATDGPEVVHVG